MNQHDRHTQHALWHSHMHGLPLEKEISLVPLFLPTFFRKTLLEAIIRLGNSCRLFSTGIEALF